MKSTTMPPPLNDDRDGIDVHAVSTPLFKGNPTYTQIKQAPGIANCPVASILSAFAFATGGAFIKNMVIEKADDVSTDISKIPPSRLSNPPKGNTVKSDRYFTVKLRGGGVEVSDVLYTDDHDSGWSPFYLRDPGDDTIWGSIVEKALAVQFKGYENFDATDTKANEFWARISGVEPGGIAIDNSTALNDILDAANNSLHRPTIGASKPESADVKIVSEFHGYAMIGVQDPKGQNPKIKLYDAAKATTIFISAADFRHDFQAILWRK